MPPSRTSRLEPRPMTEQRQFCLRAKTDKDGESGLCLRLDPEPRRAADAQRGVFRNGLVKSHDARANNALQLLEQRQIARERRALLMDVAGAHAHHNVPPARSRCARSQMESSRCCGSKCAPLCPCAIIASTNRLAADAGDRLLRSCGINVSATHTTEASSKAAPNSAASACVRV